MPLDTDRSEARAQAIFSHPDVRSVARVFGTAAVLLVALSLAAGPGGAGRFEVTLAGVAGGLAWWSFLEYVLHRFILHWEPRGPRGKALRRRLPGHRGHHDTPGDPERVVNTRRSIALPIAVPLVLGMLVPGVSPPLAMAALGGGAAGYVAYECVHVGCHLGQRPGGYWRMIRRHHALHHHRDETANFGVTSPLWDILLRTRFHAPGSSRR
ncbi:sterol desaturase family protein [Paroceanicella profunda]|uniref:sterol desaturase family protein n=1 Tax=Paroceanicella profunda TaxID=2579971 RepID=UPI001478BF85|nr:sterol desaturase family protein [Paroceanicella profunda]